MTDANTFLVTLAERLAEAYVVHTKPREILLAGSAAEGRATASPTSTSSFTTTSCPPMKRLRWHESWAKGVSAPPRGDGLSRIEEFNLLGVDCQVGHITIAAWERDMAAVLVEHTPATSPKSHHGAARRRSPPRGEPDWPVAAAGNGLPRGPRARNHRSLPANLPLWLAPERWTSRDAAIFYHQALVESSLNLLGMLAGLNRLYYSRFQFKRLRQFVAGMHLAPANLADRLDALFTLEPVIAGATLELLLAETVALVETHMPTVDTEPARRHLGQRHHPWTHRRETVRRET